MAIATFQSDAKSTPRDDRPRLVHKVRFVTATSLFDGHDAAIHIMRRILQSEGAEVIHLGHNRSVEAIVSAAIQEDVQGIAVSSYQGGHIEFFSYMLEMLRARNAEHIRVYGGGGGVIVPDEIAQLHRLGVARIFSPEDGAKMGLVGMIRLMLDECDRAPGPLLTELGDNYRYDQPARIARAITTIEAIHAGGNGLSNHLVNEIASRLHSIDLPPIVGFTGTGGAGKSSLVDEVLLRFLNAFPKKRVAVLCVDPSRRRTGGALLGDRIRLNAAERSDRVFVRSLATRRANLATSAAVKDALNALAAASFDLVVLETAGIGQSDSEVADLADVSVYVMTPEYGAPSQLEKIAMLDDADVIVINKFDKQGATDALADVRKAVQRNRQAFHTRLDEMPVVATTAHRFNDLGVNRFFNRLVDELAHRDRDLSTWRSEPLSEGDAATDRLIPSQHEHYLGDIAKSVRDHHAKTEQQADLAYRADGVLRTLRELGDTTPPSGDPYDAESLVDERIAAEVLALRQRYNDLIAQMDMSSRQSVRSHETVVDTYEQVT
ncbi:MAG: cobalamin-dependent protein, partial [Pirellulales bacterium]|nr:cobalamin-dependent protein [Pirellulales bacterium]